jgi:hypothetical protein
MSPSLTQIRVNLQPIRRVVLDVPPTEVAMRRTTPLVVLALLLAGCSDSDPSPAAVRTAAPPSPSAVSSPSTEPSAPPSPRAAGTAARAIYYLRDSGRGPRLYREFHPRPATTGVLRDAVTAMLTERPYDKDYTSLWEPSTRVLGVRLDGSTAVVDVSGDTAESAHGAAAEEATLQQLVWTVTAADPKVKAVRLIVDGTPITSLWGHSDASGPMTRRSAAEVLGPVWLTAPGTLKRGARFGGEATVFEATVSWEFRQGDRVVKSGHTNATTGAPGRGTWSAVADVPPGSYVLRAYESSAEDGRPLHIDDKPVTVTP